MLEKNITFYFEELDLQDGEEFEAKFFWTYSPWR
jgi:hypothetical protein